MEERRISKTLSLNDTGETGGHQAGILVPKEKQLLSFFPYLNPEVYNPRSHLIFVDDSEDQWEFAFIYYNNRFFGGTRNEYRLTRMTRYLRESGLVSGDELILSRSAEGSYSVSYEKKLATSVAKRNVIRLGSGWKVIDI